MEITQRDEDLLRWIHAFGFVDIRHISERYGIKNKTAYAIMQRLVKNHYVNYQRVYHRQPGVYGLTALGKALCGSELSVIRQVSTATCRHDLLVVSVAQYLQARYGGTFITERQLRHQAGSTGVGRKGHFSDGQLLFGDKTIAIEVELSLKGRQRLARIHADYLKCIAIDKVWYFCGSTTLKDRLETVDQSYQRLACFLLNDILPRSVL